MVKKGPTNSGKVLPPSSDDPRKKTFFSSGRCSLSHAYCFQFQHKAHTIAITHWKIKIRPRSYVTELIELGAR